MGYWNPPKKIIVSFDYEKDRHYKNLISAWNSHPKINIKFLDRTPKEIQSNDIRVIKRVLSRKINESDVMLVIVGKEANKIHRDYIAIGYRNWQNYEIAKFKSSPNKQLIAIKLNRLYQSPEELLNAGADWVQKFTQQGLLNALNL